MNHLWKMGTRLGLGLLLLLAVITLVHPLTAAAAPLDDDIIYVVKPGDTLRSIAAANGTSISAIVQANHLANADVIYPGQRLMIPGQPGSGGGGGNAGGSSSSSTVYTVKLGDTLDKIARAHGVSSSAIISANDISNPDLIWVGQRLVIPGRSGADSTGDNATPVPTAVAPPAAPTAVTPTATSSAAVTPTPAAPLPPPTPKPTASAPTIYVVQAGDTLSQIAQRYGTTVAALVEVNGLGNADMIRVGMRLTIPRAGSASPSSSPRPTSFVVSISQQRCWLYRGSTVIAKWVCSTGRSGSGTRPGSYRIQSKMAKAYGSTWNIWMPFWLGIYWAGASENGIHGLPWNAKTGVQVWTGYVGTPITYGCVMLDNVNAKMLYDMAYIGMPVVIKP